MLTHLSKELLASQLTEALGSEVRVTQLRATAGGDINTCFDVQSSVGSYFLKTNDCTQAAAMFQAESSALMQLRRQSALFVPNPVIQGNAGSTHFLLLEALSFDKQHNWAALGGGLAELHRQQAEQYGWHQDNFIGTSKQINRPSNHWGEFWWHCRLKPQLDWACERGFNQQLQSLIDPLQTASEAILRDHQPPPSLLHGDLWRGNVGFCQGAQPAIFDPASYYGDRETDIAMTQLFGGFSKNFYTAYEAAWPLPGGHQKRACLYNLYHLLNHLNLFGGGYLPQCVAMIKNVL